MEPATELLPYREDPIVVRIDRARLLLAEARDATDAKRVADLARAAEVYAKRQGLAKEAIDIAHAIMVDAVTLMGEMLKAVEKNRGAQGSGVNQHTKEVRSKTATAPPPPAPPTLADVGISKKESSDAQALAAIKAKKPELHEQIRSGKVKVSAARAEVKREVKREELKAKAKAAEKAAKRADAPPAWEVIKGTVGHPDHDRCKLSCVAAGSVRLVFADPPYNIGFDYGEGHDDRLTDAAYMAWVGHWVRACVRSLAADGSMWVLINDEYAAKYAVLLKQSGLTIRNWVVWYETFGVNCVDKFNRTKRHLFYCVSDPKRLVFHPAAVSRPSDRQTKYDDPRANPAGKILDDVWTDIPRLVGTAAERLPDFPTQLPLALLRRVVACSSDPGDLVLDPFSGSATTGVAAVQLGRRYLGVERSKTFRELSILRLRGTRHEPG